MKGAWCGLAVSSSLGLLLCAAAPLRADTVLPAPVGSLPEGLTTDGTVLYLNSASGFRDIYTLNPSDGAVLGSFPGYFEQPADLEFDAVNRIFLSNYAASLVEEITLSGTLVNSFSVPFQPGAIAFDGTNLYIFDSGSSLVRVTDRSGLFVGSMSLDRRPSSAVWDASTGRIITVDEFDRTSVCSTPTDTSWIRTRVRISTLVRVLAVSPLSARRSTSSEHQRRGPTGIAFMSLVRFAATGISVPPSSATTATPWLAIAARPPANTRAAAAPVTTPPCATATRPVMAPAPVSPARRSTAMTATPALPTPATR